jgi:hypothetical protein
MNEHRMGPRELEARAADSPVQTTKQRICMARDTAIKAQITCVMSSDRPAAEALDPLAGRGHAAGRPLAGSGESERNPKRTMPGNIGALTMVRSSDHFLGESLQLGARP